MSNTPGVIFDMDGVIVHSNPAHKKAIQIFCEKHNQDVSETFLHERLYGRTNKEWIPELFGELTPKKLKELADEKEQLFRDLFEPEEHIVQGIHSFLEDLKSHDVAMAVATSAPVENADYILSRLDIRPFFDVVLDSSHVSKGKPDPEVYLKASEALGKSPENCIVFEDSIAGVKAGLGAECYVVGVTTTHTEDEFEACHRVIDDFEQVDYRTLPDLITS